MADGRQYIDIIGIQQDLGASKRGASMGPAAIRYADIHAKLDEMGISWRDLGDIVPMSQGQTKSDMKNYEQIIEANERLYHKVYQSFEDGRTPIILGGDHSIAAGSIPAASRHLGDIGVIWVDAHGDFNSPQSSGSGNMHGMPYSAVCGHGPAEMVAYANYPVNPKRCVQIAGRDIDPLERVRMREAGITVFSMADIDMLGISEVIRRALAIASQDTKGIHISFDIDAVTPDEAPGTGTPVHNGLTAREAFLTMAMFSQCDKICSLDMVEVNPLLDTNNKTAVLACELILSFLGKRLY